MTLKDLYETIENNIRELTKDYYVINVEAERVSLQGHYSSDLIRKLPQVLQDNMKFENGNCFNEATAGLDEYNYSIRIVLS